MHPLADAVAVVYVGQADQIARAAADGARIDALVGQAVQVTDPVAFRALVVETEARLREWRTNVGTAAVAVYVEQVRRALWTRACATFGATAARDLAQPPTEPLTVPPSPLQVMHARRPRSLFGL